MTKKINADLLKQFENVGQAEVSVEQNETIESMRVVFTTYPKNYFTQLDFVKHLNKSNPFINHQLHKLLAENFIKRVGTKRKYYYIKA